MRIRTIKPEFWSSESLAGLSDFTLLLAIGLLNYADDEGYFNANPALIRSSLFPLRDECSTIPVSITELSNRGFLKLYSATDGRTYGCITNFEKHQVINKPKRSKLKEFCVFEKGILDLYGTNPVQVPSGTGIREQGSGNREQGSGGVGGRTPSGSLPLSGGPHDLTLIAEGTEAQPQPKGQIKTPAQLRAEKLHGKRPGTPWDRAELAAWKTAKAVVEATSEEEWQLLEAFYAVPQHQTYARKELAQTLNNWSGEITKARAFKANGKKYPGAMR